MPKRKLGLKETKNSIKRMVNTQREGNLLKSSSVETAPESNVNHAFSSCDVICKDILMLARSYHKALHFKENNLFSPQQNNILKNIKTLTGDLPNISTSDDLVGMVNFLFQRFGGTRKLFSEGLDKSMLIYIMSWKLLRGKFRPRLINLIGENSDVLAQKVSRECYKDLQVLLRSHREKETKGRLLISSCRSDVLNLVKNLSTLRGVGPATASAILSMMSPEIPFMSDEGLYHMLKKNPTKYDLKVYGEYLDFVDAEAQRLGLNETVINLDKLSVPLILERYWFSKTILKGTSLVSSLE